MESETQKKFTVVDVQHDLIVSIEIGESASIQQLKASIESKSGVGSNQQILKYERQVLDERKKVSDYNIKGDEIVQLLRMPPFNPSQPLAGIDMRSIDADELQQVMKFYRPLWTFVQGRPDLLRAVVHPDASIMETFLSEIQGRPPKPIPNAHPPLHPQQVEMRRRLIENPDDEEAKKFMEEESRLKEVRENYINAMEYAPEAFGNVVMLYINCEVNNFPLKAFVDSGAQMSVMSKRCAEQCGIIRLMDPMWSGVAKGVGSAKILGRVHLTQLRVGQSFFNLPITILDQDDLDFLLGLNFLRSHQCTIDLRENILRIGDEVTPFLSESELPQNALRGEEASTPLTPNVVNPFDRAHAQRTQLAEPSEEHVSLLTGMGISREYATELLRQTNNNVELAASLLLDK